MNARKARPKVMDEYVFEANLYDKIWGRYDYDADVGFLDRLFRKSGCRKIIDIGCGTGNHSLKLANLGYEVAALDVSQTMLKILESKAKDHRIRIKQGDMRKLPHIFPKERFDAAIMLGHVAYHLNTDSEVQALLKGVHKILKQNGLFVFNARNSKRIDENLLNNLRVGHLVSDDETQIVVLEHNVRDSRDPSTIVWRPIFLVKEKGRVDFQIREHRLRWFQFKELEKLLNENGFRIASTYSGPLGKRFNQDLHADMWFVATAQ